MYNFQEIEIYFRYRKSLSKARSSLYTSPPGDFHHFVGLLCFTGLHLHWNEFSFLKQYWNEGTLQRKKVASCLVEVTRARNNSILFYGFAFFLLQIKSACEDPLVCSGRGVCTPTTENLKGYKCKCDGGYSGCNCEVRQLMEKNKSGFILVGENFVSHLENPTNFFKLLAPPPLKFRN